jgi:hypothetical protein
VASASCIRKFSYTRIIGLSRYQRLLIICEWNCISVARGSLVVDALCYKPGGADSRPDEVNELFQFT